MLFTQNHVQTTQRRQAKAGRNLIPCSEVWFADEAAAIAAEKVRLAHGKEAEKRQSLFDLRPSRRLD